MASKTVEIPGIGPVQLQKRKGSRHIRISLSVDGEVRVSLPTWVPYATAISFAKQKASWIESQRKPKLILRHGMRIGKKHVLEFAVSSSGKLTTRVTSQQIFIKIPVNLTVKHLEVQKAAVKACIRALKQEAEAELPGRLRQLASEQGFDFSSVEVKRLKSRWGSCTNRKDITLNLFLMQLPWELIDYVLLHELMHTQIMAHGPKFWSALGEHVENLAQKRKLIREHRPTVTEALSISSMA